MMNAANASMVGASSCSVAAALSASAQIGHGVRSIVDVVSVVRVEGQVGATCRVNGVKRARCRYKVGGIVHAWQRNAKLVLHFRPSFQPLPHHARRPPTAVVQRASSWQSTAASNKRKALLSWPHESKAHVHCLGIRGDDWCRTFS